MKTILKTLVGSRSHGLHHEGSDYDYRGVFLQTTSDMFRIGYKPVTTQWIEGKEDQTSYELGHFLQLATKSNPSILEVFVAPIQEITKEGEDLRELFPYVWNSTDVYNSFTGYSHNQQKKFMDEKDNRTSKYAVAYIRVLLLAKELLSEGTMSLKIKDEKIKNMLLEIKAGFLNKGDVINIAEKLKLEVKKAYEVNKDKKTDFDMVNDYILSVRKGNW
jgi:predicted nucleotidyltransferase